MDDAKVVKGDTSRREFLKNMAAGVGGLALAGSATSAFPSAFPGVAPSSSMPDYANHIGLELWTVRDLVAKDYVGTLEKVAQIGYKEIEPAEGYDHLSPRAFRAMLDRVGLTMPSTHSGITAGPIAEVEKRLAGFQTMGIEYTSLNETPPRASRGPARGGRRAPARVPPSPAQIRALRERAMARMARPRTVENVKQEAAELNRYGKIAQKYGIRILRHNHTVEFVPCVGTPQVPYSILLAETDPNLVVFQMDIGLLVIAGQKPIDWFHRHPGRFVLWHVKDAACLKCLPPVSNEAARFADARQVPVGLGDIDYKEIFKYAGLAGMKHFDVEQNSAASWGDSIAAARVSYRNLYKMLTGKA